MPELYKVTEEENNTVTLKFNSGDTVWRYKISSRKPDTYTIGDKITIEGEPYRITYFEGLDIYNHTLRNVYQVMPLNNQPDKTLTTVSISVFIAELTPLDY
jgi:hypothetical protein